MFYNIIVKKYEPYLESIWDCVVDQLMWCLLGKSWNEAAGLPTPYHNTESVFNLRFYKLLVCSEGKYTLVMLFCDSVSWYTAAGMRTGTLGGCLCALCIDWAPLCTSVSETDRREKHPIPSKVSFDMRKSILSSHEWNRRDIGYPWIRLINVSM